MEKTLQCLDLAIRILKWEFPMTQEIEEESSCVRTHSVNTSGQIFTKNFPLENSISTALYIIEVVCPEKKKVN